MELVKPDIGLLFWMTICFVLLLILMKKYAWGPILKALNDRENGIRDALNEAQKARDEISLLKENQNNIIIEAKAEREVIISEAKKFVDEYKIEQKTLIDQEMNKRLQSVQDSIQKEKQAAMDSIKKSVASLSVEIAEKILEKKLESDTEQQDLINKSLEKLDVK